MIKITCFASLLFLGSTLQAQLSFEASKDYGKLQDITYDVTTANKLYAHTYGNHIVVSTDNGLSWQLLYSFPNEGASISKMQVAASNDALSFIVGNSGAATNGIYLYNLASNTITDHYTAPNASDNPSLATYSIYDATGNNVLLHDTYSIGLENFTKVFYTSNGGTSWSEVYYNVENDYVHVNNVAISPADPEHLFIARSLGPNDVDGGIFVSEDAGENWTLSLDGIAVDQIAFNPDDATEILLGTGINFGAAPENLYRSNDNGVNWDIIEIDWTDVTLDNITKIVYNAANPDNVILLEENEIVITNDHGVTWQNIVYPVDALTYYYGLNASINPFNDDEVFITTDYFPQFSTDGGVTLTQSKNPFYNITTVSVDDKGASQGIYYGSNGGNLYKNLTSGVTTASFVENVDQFNPARATVVADPAIPGRVFIHAGMGFFGSNLYYSTDYGVTRNFIMQAFSDNMEAIAVDPVNSNIVWVSLRSQDQSTVYKINLTNPAEITNEEVVTPDPAGVTTGIVISATNPDIVFIAKNTGFYTSTDGGATWNAFIDGLDDLDPAMDIIWNMNSNPLNPAQFSLATNEGVFSTSDAGLTWEHTLSGQNTRVVKYSPYFNGLLIAGIYSAENAQTSIYYTCNHGNDWAGVTPENLHYLQAYSMDYKFDGRNVDAYIATTDLGVVKYRIENLPLGINPISKDAQAISIYPNPASTIVNIQLDPKLQIASAAIYDIAGKQVLESTQTSIDVSALSLGTYVIRVNTVDGQLFVQKLVKH
jgi:xyloglucan-specific exo-beta-1,4-glucanase